MTLNLNHIDSLTNAPWQTCQGEICTGGLPRGACQELQVRSRTVCNMLFHQVDSGHIFTRAEIFPAHFFVESSVDGVIWIFADFILKPLDIFFAILPAVPDEGLRVAEAYNKRIFSELHAKFSSGL